MELFQLSNNKLTFAPQTLLLEPYHKLWVRDKSKDKETAVAELGYVWYQCDIKSPFSIILSTEERTKEIKKIIKELNGSWMPDQIVREACLFYKESQKTVSSEILDNTIGVMLKINNFLATLDPGETYTDKFGNIKFTHDFKKIVSTVKEVPGILETLNKVKEQVLKEQEVDTGMRGNKTKSLFEGGV